MNDMRAGQAGKGRTPAVEIPIITPDQALKRLYEGNQRWIAGKPIFPNVDTARRAGVAKEQKPFAVVFGCADSRVSPELVFDCGLGDLFVVRTAAHMLDSAAMGSIEFGVEVLAIPLIMVMGHKRCGAIAAAVEAAQSNRTPPGQIKLLVDNLMPAIDLGIPQYGDIVEHTVLAQVKLTIEKLRTSTVIVEKVNAGKVGVVGACYDLDTGAVEITVKMPGAGEFPSPVWGFEP